MIIVKKNWNGWKKDRINQLLSVTPRVSSSSPSQSTRSRDTSNHDFNRLVCCVCSETDTENNLTAADTFHVTKNKVDINHVPNLTWHYWVIVNYHNYHLEILLTMTFMTIKVLLRIVMSNSALNISKHKRIQMKMKLTSC